MQILLNLAVWKMVHYFLFKWVFLQSWHIAVEVQKSRRGLSNLLYSLPLALEAGFIISISAFADYTFQAVRSIL